MKLEKKYQVAIRKNSNGECVEFLDCKIIGSEEYKALKKECAVINAKKEESEKEELKVAKEKALIKENKKEIANIFLAKVVFDNLVDLGKEETTEEFEEMYDKFVNGLGFNKSIAPSKFLKILERLG